MESGMLLGGYVPSDGFGFMKNRENLWWADKEEYAAATGNTDNLYGLYKTSDYPGDNYWKDRLRRGQSDVDLAKGIALQGQTGLGLLNNAYNSRVNDSFINMQRTMSQWEKLRRMNSLGGSGTIIGIDTETLGYVQSSDPNAFKAITEMGFAQIDVSEGMIAGQQKSTAVFGINDDQYKQALALVDRLAKTDEFSSLNRTEQSTIRRLSKYGGIFNYNKKNGSISGGLINKPAIGNSDVGLWMMKEGTQLLPDNPYDLDQVRSGIESLHNLYTYGYKGKQDQAMTAVVNLFNGFSVAAADPSNNTVITAKNARFDINAIINTGGRLNANMRDVIVDAENMIDVLAEKYHTTRAGATYYIKGEPMKNAGATEQSLVEAQGLGNADLFESDLAHVAGVDSYYEALGFVNPKAKGLNNKSLIKETIDAANELYPKHNETSVDLTDDYIYIKSGASDRRYTALSRENEAGELKYIKNSLELSPAGQIWEIDQVMTGATTREAFSVKKGQEDIELFQEKTGFMLTLKNASDKKLRSHIFFEDTDEQSGLDRATSFLSGNTKFYDKSKPQEAIDRINSMRYKEEARKLIDGFSDVDRGGYDSFVKTSGIYDEISSIVGTGKKAKKLLESGEFINLPEIQEIIGAHEKDINYGYTSLRTIGMMSDYFEGNRHFRTFMSEKINNSGAVDNVSRTIIFNRALDSVNNMMEKNGYRIVEKVAPPVPIDVYNLEFALGDQNAIVDLTSPYAASNLTRALSKKNDYEGTAILRKSAKNLIERGMISSDDLEKIEGMFSRDNNAYAYADLLINAARENRFKNGFSSGGMTRIYSDAYTKLYPKYSKVDSDTSGEYTFDSFTFDARTSRADELSKTVDEAIASQKGVKTRSINRMRKNNEKGPININEAGLISSESKIAPITMKPSVYSLDVNGNLIGEQVQAGSIQSVLSNLGYQTSSKGEKPTQIENFVNKLFTIGDERLVYTDKNGATQKWNQDLSVSWSIAHHTLQEQGIRSMLTYNDNGLYAVVTNDENQNKVRQAISALGSDYTMADIKKAVEGNAAVIAMPRVRKRIVGIKDKEFGVPQEVLDFIGNGETIELESTVRGSGIETFHTNDLNFFVNKEGKMLGGLEKSSLAAPTSFKKVGVTTLNEIKAGEFARAQNQINRAYNKAMESAPMTNSFLTTMDSEGNLIKSMQISERDIARAYQVNLGTAESGEATGLMYLLKKQAYGDASTNKLFNKESEGIFALFNATDISPIYDKNNGGVKISGFSEQEIQRMLENERFKQFYTQTLYTRSNVHDRLKTSDGRIIGRNSYGIGDVQEIKDLSSSNPDIYNRIMQNNFGITQIKDGDTLQGIGDKSILEIITNPVLNDINSDKYDAGMRDTIEKLRNAAQYINWNLPASAIQGGGASFFYNIVRTAQAASESSSIRPTAVSQQDKYRFIAGQFIDELESKGFSPEELGISIATPFMSKDSYRDFLVGNIKNANAFTINGELIPRNQTQGEFVGTLKQMSQTEINARVNTDNLELARSIAMRKYNDTGKVERQINVIREMVAGMQNNEGKFFIDPVLKDQDYVRGAEAFKVIVPEFKDIIKENGSLNEDMIKESKKLIKEHFKKTHRINRGDIIGFRTDENGNTRTIKWNNEDAYFDDDMLNDLFKRGETLAAPTYGTRSDSTKWNIAQEKNTEWAMTADYAQERFGFDSRQEALDALKFSWDFITGTEQARESGGIVMPITAVTNFNDIKHGLGLSTETQMNLIGRAYKDRPNDFLTDLKNAGLSNFIDDYGFQVVGDKIIYDTSSSEKGLGIAFEKIMNAMYEGKIGKAQLYDTTVNQYIIDEYEYMINNRLGLVDFSRVNMRQMTAKNGYIDPRFRQIMRDVKGDKIINQYFKEHGIDEDLFSKYVDLLRERSTGGINSFNKNYGSGIGDEGYIPRLIKEKYLDAHGGYHYSEDEREIFGMEKFIKFIAGEYDESLADGNANFVNISLDEITSKLPSTGGDLEDYSMIFRRNGEISNVLLDKAREQHISVDEKNINSFVLDLTGTKPIIMHDVSGKERKLNKLVLPLLSNTSRENTFKRESVSAQIRFLNALKAYNNPSTIDAKRLNGRTAEEWMEGQLINYYKSIREQFDISDKNSDIFRKMLRIRVPNAAEVLGQSSVVMTPLEDIVTPARDYESSLINKARSGKEITESEIYELAKKYNAVTEQGKEYASLITSNNPADWIDKLKEKGLFIPDAKKYGDYIFINKEGELINSVLTGKETFENAGVDFTYIGMQLFDNASAYDDVARFENQTMKIMSFDGKSFTEVESVVGGKYKVNKDIISKKYLDILESKNEKIASSDLTNKISDLRNRLSKGEDVSKDIIENIKNMEKLLDSNKAFAGNEEAKRLLRLVNKSGFSTAERRELALQEIHKINQQVFEQIGIDYAKNVGIQGQAIRYPLFNFGSAELISKIYFDESLHNSAMFFGPQFPQKMHLDFDADEVFLMFNIHTGLFRKNDKMYEMFENMYKASAATNPEALKAYFTGAEWSKGTNVSNSMYSLYKRTMEQSPEAKAALEGARTQFFERKGWTDLWEKAQKDDGLKNALEMTAALRSHEVLETLDMHNINTLESIGNVLATIKAATTKKQIGYVSNPGRNIRYALTELEDHATDSQLKLLQRMRKDLTNVGVKTTDGSVFGAIGALDVSEQLGIDVKKIFEGESLALTSAYSTVMGYLFNPDSVKHEKYLHRNLSDMLKITQKTIFADSSYNGNHDEAANFILGHSYEEIESFYNKAIKPEDRRTYEGFMQMKSLIELSNNQKARDLYNSPLLSSKKSNDMFEDSKNLLEAISGLKDSDSVFGDVYDIFKSRVKDDQAFIANIEPDKYYASKPSLTNDTKFYKFEEYSYNNGKAKATYKDFDEKTISFIADTNRELNEKVREFFEFNIYGGKDGELLPSSIPVQENASTSDINIAKERAAHSTAMEIINEAINNNKPVATGRKNGALIDDLEELLGTTRKQRDASLAYLKKAVGYADYKYTEAGNTGDINSKIMLTEINKNYQRRKNNAEDGGSLKSLIDDFLRERHVLDGMKDDVDYSQYKIIQDAREAIKNNGFIDISAKEKMYDKYIKGIDDVIEKYGSEEIKNEQAISVAKEAKEQIQEQIQKRLTTDFENNQQIEANAMEKMYKELKGDFNLDAIFNWEGVFDANGNITSDSSVLDFSKIQIGYGHQATMTFSELTENELNDLINRLKNSKINTKEGKAMVDKTRQLAEAYMASNPTYSQGSHGNIGEELTKQIIDKEEPWFAEMLNNFNNYRGGKDQEQFKQAINNQLNGGSSSGVRPTPPSFSSGEEKSIFKSLNKLLSDFKEGMPEMNINGKHAAMVAALLLAPGIIGRVGHSIKTGDPLVPHSARMEGKNPYTGDPLANTEAQDAENSRRKEQAPPTVSNIYVDRDTGLHFKVSARSASVLNYSQISGQLRASGIDTSHFTQRSDTSEIDDVWLENQFARYL